MEEIITKDNYANHLANLFNKNQEQVNNIIDKINEEKDITGFPEIRDMTPRFFNSSINAIKYFNKNKINYYDNITTNPEQIAMSAWESYIIFITII